MANERREIMYEVKVESWGKLKVLATCPTIKEARAKLEKLHERYPTCFIQCPQSALDIRNRMVTIQRACTKPRLLNNRY